MCRKWPELPSSCLLTTDSGRNRVFTGCYFFACLVFSPHDMNVFVTNFFSVVTVHIIVHVLHVVPYIFCRFQVDMLKMSHIKFHISCSFLKLNVNHARYSVYYCWIGMAQMSRKCPEHPNSFLLRADSGRNRVLTSCYFFACLVFSPHDMNVFVTNLTVDHVVTHVQGFFSGILII